MQAPRRRPGCQLPHRRTATEHGGRGSPEGSFLPQAPGIKVPSLTAMDLSGKASRSSSGQIALTVLHARLGAWLRAASIPVGG